MLSRYLGALLLITAANTAIAQNCIDTDGDGWGWDGEASCRVSTTPLTASACIDSPPLGDGWGWDGTKSCRIDGSGTIEPTSSVCIDSAPLGDGWGWDGTQSCRVTSPVVVASVCVDSPPLGDGWGWDGTQSCRVANTATGTPTQSAAERLPSGGHVSNPQFQWARVNGAESYRLIVEDHRGDRISQHMQSRDAGCDDTDTCRFTPSVQIHDSILNWRVQAFNSSGNIIQTSEDVSFNTLRSLPVQPYTDHDTIGAPPNPGHGFPTLEYDQYLVLNNDWNRRAMFRDDWQQSVSIDRLADGNTEVVIEYDWLAQNDGDEFAVKSYPQIVYGNKLGAHVSGSKAELGLPETVTNLQEFRIDYSYTETGNAERNLAFESFFHTDCDIGGPNFEDDDREYEMMVWIANPSIRTPGTIRAETGVMIDNQLWDVWIKPQQDDKYIAFTAVNEVASGTLNWNRFVDWTVNWSNANRPVYGIKALNTNWCMSAIEFGPETFWGASTLTLNEFRITRQ